MQDGLYQVTTKYFCAGFEVKNGKIINCAPILKKRIEYWKTVSKRVEVEFKKDNKNE